jgi:hypothetical protein
MERGSLLRIIFLLAGISGCASTELSGLPHTASEPPAAANWGVTESGRYAFDLEERKYRKMKGDDGRPLTTCPSGYKELQIPGTPLDIDARECRQPNHHSPPIDEGEYARTNDGCQRPRAVAIVNGSYECLTTCPANQIPIPKQQGYDLCE